MAAQYLGSLTASLLVFLTYWDSLVWYEHDRGEYRTTPDTARIFTTFPSPHLSVVGGVIDQLVGSAVFLICICAITDSRNMRVPMQSVPLFVGVTVLGLGLSLGYNTGCAINPARDLGPRVFTLLAGWGPGVFTEYNHWWIVPVIACHVGALAGAWLYYLAVEINWPLEEEEEKLTGRRPGGVERNGGGGVGLQPPHPHSNIQQPAENPGYTNGHLARGDSRPHTPEDEKYQPIKSKALEAGLQHR